MPSPFPGMDPYLEDPAYYPDFHSTFINYARERLLETLPAHYTARIGERVYLVDGPIRQEKLISPDIAIERQPGPRAKGGTATATATTTLLKPTTLPLPVLEQPRETFIEILHREDRSLVTVLELLSPANKTQPGRGFYLAKRNGLLIREVNLVELDLLIGGQHLPLRAEIELPAGDYYAYISPADRRPDCDVYHWELPRTLPSLPIPLRAPDPAVIFDLAAVFALVYERGGYAQEIDYARPPGVNVSEDRMQWIGTVVQGTRPN